MIFLLTDYGWQGPWVGQLHTVLRRHHSAPTVIDLMHDAPTFSPGATGHLLAALVTDLPEGSVCCAVVDPGVGTARLPVVVEADGRWFVGPGNGLFDVLAARAERAQWWRITRAPERACATFHGRDLFAPVAAALARGEPVPGDAIEPMHDPEAAAERPCVIYIDGFGNAATGLRAADEEYRQLAVGSRRLRRARTFADGAPGELFWIANSMGLVEIVANQASAADQLGLTIGTDVGWVDGLAAEV